MHAARISGGDVSNIISGRPEALLDIRLTETSTVEDLAKNLREACAPGVSYEIVSASTPVVMSEDNPQILAYKRLAEQVTGRKIVFEQIGGATDARLFAKKGATVIMHSVRARACMPTANMWSGSRSKSWHGFRLNT